MHPKQLRDRPKRGALAESEQFQAECSNDNNDYSNIAIEIVLNVLHLIWDYMSQGTTLSNRSFEYILLLFE